MEKLNVGTIHAMHVLGQLENDDKYVVQKGRTEALLQTEKSYDPGDLVDVFVYKNEQKKFMATDQIPPVIVGTYGWVDVVDVIPHLGAFISIGVGEDILVFKEDLPAFKSVWPEREDKLFVTLKADSKDRLLAIPAKESYFQDMFQFANDVDLNEQVTGRVIRVDREGAVIYTDDGYRGFIHNTEREKEPRLGQSVTGRIIEVKEDGSLNISLLPMKHERLDDDAEKILAYLTEVGGEMDFWDKSDAEAIKRTFHMSKSAFKRALGRLMKHGKITQQDGKTKLN
ncbi:MAG TPA: hypothetical protein H9895_02850 [Candidatus Pseudogracilibacillus intestinigallinarum]|uniref:S1 motif domain-containing protein n=1 Tax=Candidatus Pseudogracilibacillus intestinigallinarum TaxID=2838742 RepID=A0A9D1PLF4_9BACI|nr:hypothetical protein [Candidatus Pseudogracilibacillus intestinigallinarum]